MIKSMSLLRVVMLFCCSSRTTTNALGGLDPTTLVTHFHSHSHSHALWTTTTTTMASSIATATATTTTTTSPAFVNNMNPISVYLHALETWPLYTKMATGATLAVAGDAIAQTREVDQPYNKRRAGSFAIFDMAYRALQHATYPSIVAHFHGQYLCSVASLVLSQYYLPLDFAAALERTLCSQLGIVPFIYYPVFFTLTAALQGLDAEAGVQRAKDMFLPLMQRNLLFWIPAQYIQFSYVPEDLQIPFVSVCGLVWTAILSVLAGAAAAKDSIEEEHYCVIGNEDQCLLPEDALFPHATMEDVVEELTHEWEVVTHELDEVAHAVVDELAHDWEVVTHELDELTHSVLHIGEHRDDDDDNDDDNNKEQSETTKEEETTEMFR
uniref:Uncharacterized protein n=1 Tax=Amphora coffeiformis TaxID=265554 RepID=A0A6S8J8B3_9STRA|mmetsp:Transcript_17669/g.33227  ORF Transcript_17669/g.33227 Transcript_17669/m.33227 type:complete len:382 (-) Transcript_17669:98-1243(-)